MAFDNLGEKLGEVFKKLRGKAKLSEGDVKAAMREIKLALLEADVNFKVVRDFIKTAGDRAVGAEVLESLTPAQQVIKIVHEELCALMGGQNSKIALSSTPPTVVMLCGLQGAGKTTHCAKLANLYKKQNKRPLMVAADVYRPAAIKQLMVLGEQLAIPVFAPGDKMKPPDIAKAAIAHARANGNDIVFIDTAGRLHIDETLMDELKAIKADVSPHEILLVIDAMTGQDAVNAAKSFDEALGIDGVIITKTDGDTRGGAALSVRAVTGKPIKFAGTGEKLSDIEPFYPDRMASRILGMGDVLTLIEKAQQTVDLKKAQELEKKLRQKGFDLSDFLDQLAQLKKMGGMGDILSMIPGMDKKALAGADIDEKQFARVEAIILSMTPHERQNPSVINSSRKRRIAAGCGQKVEDVNRLLKQFDQMNKMMRQMGGQIKGKGRQKRPMGPMGGFKLPF